MTTTAYEAHKDGNKMKLDTGASGHFCVEGTTLANAKSTRRVISSAGNQTLTGEVVGDLGKLANAVAVKGLRTGLASVGKLADDSNAILIFTSNKAYAIPAKEFERGSSQLRKEQWEIGERDDTGLYVSSPDRIDKVLTKGNGFRNPRRDSVGALANVCTGGKKARRGAESAFPSYGARPV